MRWIIRMLNREYPAPQPESRNLVNALFFGLFIWLFLWFFEPYGINVSSGKDSMASLAGFGLISALVLALFLYLLPLALPGLFSDRRWQVKHQLFLLLAILLTIATLNGLFTNFIKGLPFRWANYRWIINRTFVLGGIPFSFLILLDMARKNRVHQQAANAIRLPQSEKGIPPTPWFQNIVTDLKTESFTLDANTFMYAMAVGNYIELFSWSDQQIRAHTYRISLSAFENQIKAPHLLRCHRSFLVNLRKVTEVTGNAQGLKLHLLGMQTVVPVSRKYISTVRDFFART